MTIKWKHFPHYWSFVWGIHRSPVNSPHKGQWCGALMFSLICAWTDSRANNGDTFDLRHCHAHYDVIVMYWRKKWIAGEIRCCDVHVMWGPPNVTLWDTLTGELSVASFTKEVNPQLAKCPLKTNGHLVNRGQTSLVNKATGVYPEYFEP